MNFHWSCLASAQLPRRTSGVLLPSLSMALQSAYQGSFSKLQHQGLSQRCLTCLRTFEPPWLVCGRRRHLITDNTLPICLWICRVAHSCLFGTTLIARPCGALTMDPFASLRELRNTSPSTSMEDGTLSRWIASNPPFWMPTSAFMREQNCSLPTSRSPLLLPHQLRPHRMSKTRQTLRSALLGRVVEDV